MGGQHCPPSTYQSSFDNHVEVFKVARKIARNFWQPTRDPKHNRYRLECCMDLPGNRPRVARKRYESHLVTISAKRFQKFPAKCPAFSCHFLPSVLCVPAPCVVTARGGRGAVAAWARGLPERRWEDKRTAMAYAKDFEDPRVLGDLLPPWPGDGDTFEFRDLVASQVWAAVQFASERFGRGGQRRGGGGGGGGGLTRMTVAQLKGFRNPLGPEVARSGVRLRAASKGIMSGYRGSRPAQTIGPSRTPPPLPPEDV